MNHRFHLVTLYFVPDDPSVNITHEARWPKPVQRILVTIYGDHGIFGSRPTGVGSFPLFEIQVNETGLPRCMIFWEDIHDHAVVGHSSTFSTISWNAWRWLNRRLPEPIHDVRPHESGVETLNRV
jgi:hypothetical protein